MDGWTDGRKDHVTIHAWLHASKETCLDAYKDIAIGEKDS
jgi:hypothetical protein